MTTAPYPARLDALDIFRGLAVAGMILVNTPGSGQHIWWPLAHAPWHGFTPADLVFPAFLFAVGVALALSFPRKMDTQMWWRIGTRVVLLILIGWAWQMLARPSIDNFRVLGVLPRIGLCYGAVAAIAILTAGRDEAGRAVLRPLLLLASAIALLLGYSAIMAWGGPLTPEGNLAGLVDRAIVGANHMWRFGTDAAGNVVYDPEGLFSTTPALANVLFGMLAAIAWQRWRTQSMRVLIIAGAALTLAGSWLAPIIPLNKNLWTASFVLLTTGMSALLLALCMIALRHSIVAKLLTPLRIFGMNAIAGYLLSLILGLIGIRLGIQQWAFAHLQALVGNPFLASGLYALGVALITLAALIPLHRRGLFLRI